ncbi:tRNA (adenosine(37)-N6)-threonylcarbamoyltransferase complex dimerization subunit type 1 TsaB [Candidatus Cardinium hertigii]|uniref:tRNA threonylcarbamoyladenosine biosynthesis protein TsaB n=1 Tax=Candidatus Cardinium hertigii TaxID=247481 RepID=A0A2Z3LCM2_9BACT|nr:tRNA (adenosine(37)-N6)-threonylcarbamoyltransferase complex dimerization subunit type 1 TsaB [Candidatus Cardinium hertigii]AWN81666.1 tRNA threonylcarbamoyladenosine biosynthesis protein TsaB [Candidatus Cardinium hertigii]
MVLILSIETATAACSVALHNQGHLVAHTTLVQRYTHVESLMVIVEELLEISKYNRKDLAAVAIASGPGSYTGLRIGAAVGKGLCYGLGIPLIAVPTLVAMAAGIAPCIVDKTVLLCPALDARRNAIYTLIVDRSGQIKQDTHVALVDSSAYLASLPQQPLLFLGDGALKCKPYLVKRSDIHYAEAVMPSAVHIGPLAFARFQQQCWEDIAHYVPCYLSQFQS